MRLTRVLLPGALASGATLPLPESAARHVARVLRLSAGDALRVFDGAGSEFGATIASVQRGRVDVRLGELVAHEGPPPLSITLLQGVARGEKMDLILQKATELGASRIVPVLTLRSTVKLDTEGIARRHAHWEAVIASACEQSGRATLPSLAPAAPLAAALTQTPAGSAAMRIVLAPEAGSPSLPALLPGQQEPPHALCLLVGPEGGLDTMELAQAQEAGFVRCRLGPRVLRTETAGLAAIAAAQALAGDWR